MSPSVSQPVSVVVAGRTWHLFQVEFEGSDGVFSFPIYALSREHASHIVEDIKATARLAGQIEGFVKP